MKDSGITLGQILDNFEISLECAKSLKEAIELWNRRADMAR